MISLSSSIHPSHGFHSTFTTKISFTPAFPLIKNCSLHLHYSLPPLVFVDPYELAQHDAYYSFRHWGTSNLEHPVTAVPQNDSSLLLDIQFPPNAQEIEVKLPIHLRYGAPASSQSGYQITELEWPTGFVVCPSSPTSSDSLFSSSNLPRISNEVSSLFDGSASVFFPISMSGDRSAETLQVPVGNLAHVRTVEFATALTIVLSFFYVLRASLRTWSRINSSSYRKLE